MTRIPNEIEAKCIQVLLLLSAETIRLKLPIIKLYAVPIIYEIVKNYIPVVKRGLIIFFVRYTPETQTEKTSARDTRSLWRLYSHRLLNSHYVPTIFTHKKHSIDNQISTEFGRY